MSSNHDLVQRTLDALVEEAYQQAIARGVAITNPDGWRAWKRNVYITTAKREGAGYLRAHYNRLGLAAPMPELRCAECGQRVVGTPTHKDDDPVTPYCSYDCAGIPTMSLDEWLANHATPEQRASMERLRRRQEGAA